MGTEIQKKRPAVVCSHDIMNENSSRIIVAPITSNLKKVYSFEYEIVGHSEIEGKVMIDQIRSIDKSRLGKKIGSFSMREMLGIESFLNSFSDFNKFHYFLDLPASRLIFASYKTLKLNQRLIYTKGMDTNKHYYFCSKVNRLRQCARGAYSFVFSFTFFSHFCHYCPLRRTTLFCFLHLF